MPFIHLSRHAHPDRSRTDLIYHQLPGPPLTERGVTEAQELGEYFRQSGVRTIIASPFDRCEHTARIAAELAGAEIQIEPALGEWQPGEKAEDIRQRIWPVFEKARQASSENEPVALVTHGGPIGVLLKALGMDLATLGHQHTYDYGNPLPPAGVWVATQESDEQEWKLSLSFIPSSTANGKAVGIYQSSSN